MDTLQQISDLHGRLPSYRTAEGRRSSKLLSLSWFRSLQPQAGPAAASARISALWSPTLTVQMTSPDWPFFFFNPAAPSGYADQKACWMFYNHPTTLSRSIANPTG